VGESVAIHHAANGGFPEPPPGAPVRTLAARHGGCGTRTTLRIPAVLSPLVVRRVECAGCGRPFAPIEVKEVRVPGRLWQLASIPVAAALVIGGLFLIQGGGGSNAPLASSTASPAPARPAANAKAEKGARGAKVRGAAEVVRGANFSLALPKGWRKVSPPAGATFAAAAAGGGAEATLWIERNANLEFPAFITQSLEQLRTLSPDPRVCERTPGPTPETTVVRLCADAPPGEPVYEAVLRAAGPYRYYLATTVAADAAPDAAAGVDLLAGSLTPEARR